MKLFTIYNVNSWINNNYFNSNYEGSRKSYFNEVFFNQFAKDIKKDIKTAHKSLFKEYKAKVNLKVENTFDLVFSITMVTPDYMGTAQQSLLNREIAKIKAELIAASKSYRNFTFDYIL